MDFNQNIEEKQVYGYEMPIIEYCSRGFSLLKKYFLPLFLFVIVTGIISIMIGMVPIVSLLYSIFLAPAIGAGIFTYLYAAEQRNDKTANNFFGGFKVIKPLATVVFTKGLIFLFLLLIGAILFIDLDESWKDTLKGKMTESAMSIENEGIKEEKSGITQILFPLTLILGFFYVYIIYALTPFFIAINKQDFWTAMENSRKLVNRKFFHWFGLFLIFILLFIVLVGGFFGILSTFVLSTDLSAPSLEDPLAIMTIFAKLALPILISLPIFAIIGIWFQSTLYAAYEDIIKISTDDTNTTVLAEE